LTSTPQRLDAATLGKIVFARFLEQPLATLERQVATMEASPAYADLCSTLECGILPGARLTEQPRPGSVLALGEVCLDSPTPALLYQRASFVREYRFDSSALEAHLRSRAPAGALSSAIHRMKLINSRNRLTHALVHELVALQSRFLYTRDPLDLIPMTQAELAQRLNRRANLSLRADAGRLSRLLKHLSLRSADGVLLPLSALLARSRQVHGHWIDHLIKQEQQWLLNGRIRAPLPDQALAEHLAEHHGIRLGRRTVATIRQQLAIPDWRERKLRKSYLAATEGFSPLLLLSRQALSALIPAQPGVYEIRASSETSLTGGPALTLPSTVLYIGSSGNLRKRLWNHQRGNTGNPQLLRYLAEFPVRVRFRVVASDWRILERELYRVHCETFGAPPPCNRMSP
jgi:RNA polymerase sigma-54 factor